MKKNIFLSLVVSILCVPFASADFSDIQGLSARPAVEFLQEQTIVNGFEDGTFRPTNNITRAEFLKIALKSKEDLSKKCEPVKTFSDVKTYEWYYDIVCHALNNKIVQGYEDGTFRPNDSINFRDAAKIIAEVHDVEVPENAGEEWFSGYLAALERERVKPGSISDSGQLLSRGEMSEVIWGLVTGNEVENESLGELPSITSCQDLNAQLSKFEKRNSFSGTMLRKNMNDMMFLEVEEEAAFDGDMAAGISAPTAASNESAKEYSQTNIQEIGVDEADIVKNDGSHIFMLRNNTVRILKAYPADELEQIAKIALPNISPREMFLDGNTLTIIADAWGSSQTDISTRMIMPEMDYYYGGGGSTMIFVFDVSDRTNPQEIRNVRFDGSYVSSRRVGDVVYLVAEKNWSFWGVPRPIPYETMIPAFADSAFEDEEYISSCAGIRYFPNFKHTNYLIVSAINTKDTTQRVDREVVLGGGSEIYSSPENLYVTRPSWDEVYWQDGVSAGWDYQEGTDIYRFSLGSGAVDFQAKGRVPGRVLNQFSMSEYGGHFRIATQIGQAWGSKPSSSGVFILNKNLDEVSRVDGIAPGENLKSARFMGEKGYLVTFKTVDPLFVIDLNPTSPKVLGKLKIPGWSDYLHPYDENHLIGFGKEVDESIDADKVHSDNAIYYTAVLGMKLAIFDVSDLENPKEIHKEVIGYRGTQSDILNNHKALLFDKEKGILAFPVHVTKHMNDKVGYDADIQTIFSGAQVYDISLENGFSLRGQVSHYTGDDVYLKSGEYFYGDYDLNIQRIIYIGDKFYTLSPNMVKALTWSDISEVNVLELDERSCSEIRTENECTSRSDCRAVYSGAVECVKDFG